MNVSAFSALCAVLPAARRCPCHPRRHRTAGFALVVTLLILSLLVVVAVSYLTSMINERQTADAYTAKTRAEQAAQAGIDAATAILTQSFRDFPDSATVWDPNQSVNVNTPTGGEAGTTVNTKYNEGTSLYLHAVGQTQTVNVNSNSVSTVVANPYPTGTTLPVNDNRGNNPNNPACKTFVLPLVSGVPGGYAQVASQAVTTATGASPLLPQFDLTETDPSKQTDSLRESKSVAQYCTDLNVRRYKGDLLGIIGSPSDWVNPVAPALKPLGPKPARALWINLREGDPAKVIAKTARVTGRYAFWIEDESFRANISSLGDPIHPTTLGQARPDNSSQPLVSGTSTRRALTLGDLSLPGFLSAIKDGSPDTDAKYLLSSRAVYPGSVFPEPMAFAHSTQSSDGKTTLATSLVDALGYSTTTQSGTLNFTRHGTQRLNLNGLYPTNTGSSPQPKLAIQSAVDQIVETLKFHLPDFGQRFYRSNPPLATDSTLLNTKMPDLVAGSSLSTIYLYKVAANLCDYLDSDSQPTMIVPDANRTRGLVVDPGKPDVKAVLSDDGSSNTYWAQGKESSPLIQEVAVRYRPVVATTAGGPAGMSARDFDLKVDYYIEFWNMTDRDICATQQPSNSPYAKQQHLNGASIYVRDQQAWTGYPHDVFVTDGKHGGELLPSNGDPPNNWEIDLSSGSVKNYDTTVGTLQDGTNNKHLGVVFKAGTVTVITTDPDCYNASNSGYTYNFNYEESSSGFNAPVNYGPVANPANVYYCPVVQGQREYFGHVQLSSGTADSQGGMMMGGAFTSSPYSGTEISLVNNYGFLDIVRGAITKAFGNGSTYFTNTFKFPSRYGYYNDYCFGSSLIGNVTDNTISGVGTASQPATYSEMGDPRTNNEQLSINTNSVSSNTADGSHFMPGFRTLGSPNGMTVRPNVTTNGLGWGDYFSMPGSNDPPTAPSYSAVDYTTAPAVIADGALTSIGQLGDVYDPARLVGSHGGATIQTSRGGGRTLKMGQHDDRYSADPSGNAAPNNTADNIAASNGWASWRMADVFSIDNDQEKPGRINVNGVKRDNGAALMAALDGWNFQPATLPLTDPKYDQNIHGDGHGSSGLAGKPLDTSASSQYGVTQIVNALKYHLDPPSTTVPYKGSGPLFEPGEFGELIADPNYPNDPASPMPLFGANAASASNSLVNAVDMNKTFDHGREEMFRRLSELICTRGDTFTVYVVGQSIFQAPITTPTSPPPMKVTGTHRMRVTFRLVPKASDGTLFNPPAFNGSSLATNPISSQVPKRFAKADHYEAQVLEVNTF